MAVLAQTLYMFSIAGGLLIIEVVVFYCVERLFGIEEVSWKRSLGIVFLLLVLSTVLLVLTSLSGGFDISGDLRVNMGLVVVTYLGILVIGLILATYTIHFFINRVSSIGFGKSFLIFLVFIIIGSLISVPTAFIAKKLYPYKPYLMSGDSMRPAYLSGNYLLVSRSGGEIEREDVLIFSVEEDPDTRLVKRVVGLPGETLEIKGGEVLINGQAVKNRFYHGTYPEGFVVNLKDKEYFMMGDNMDSSYDSRDFGPITEADILGRVVEVVNFRNWLGR